MGTVTVNHLTDDAFLIDVRGHTLAADEPIAGRDERGPTPVELFVASLAASVGQTVVRYLREHYLAHDGVRVEAEFRMRDARPPAIEAIRLRVLVPQDPDRQTYLGIIDAFNRSPVRVTMRESRLAILLEVRSFAEWASLTAHDPIGAPATAGRGRR
jgi:uncharacterized OsmC-like protein